MCDKVCSRCNTTKGSNEFYKCSRSLDGLQIWCKECSRRYKVEKFGDLGLNNSDKKISSEKELLTVINSWDFNSLGSITKQKLSNSSNLSLTTIDRIYKRRLDIKELIYNFNKDYKKSRTSKVCKDCGIEKPLKDFFKKNGGLLGRQTECKACTVPKSVERHRVNMKDVDYRRNYLDIRGESERRRLSKDPIFKINKNLRNGVYLSFSRSGYTKKSRTHELLGADYTTVLASLNNNPYGFTFGDEGLDIDHVIPLSSANTEEELCNLWHYKNLQLLPEEYNRHIKRENKFDKSHFEEWLQGIDY